MKYLLIQNVGEIEVEGFKLLGASTKRGDDSKIGFFGSGIKYTLAYLLRNGLFFDVYSGTKKVKFDTKEVNLRGQSFSKVTVNGEDTSITTSWGENWNRWQIFREIVSNSIDEESFTVEVVNEVRPVTGLTSFYLSYEDFREYYDEMPKYFNTKLVKEKEPSIIIKSSPSPLNVFKKGIRVLPESENHLSLFDYHLPQVSLDEARVASMWDIRYYITELLAKCMNEDQVNLLYDQILSNNDTIFEVREVLSNLNEYTTLSGKWLHVLNRKSVKVLSAGTESFIKEEKGDDYIEENEIQFIPEKFSQVVDRSFGDKFENRFKNEDLNSDFVVINLSDAKDDFLKGCIKTLSKKGLEFTNTDIKVVKFRSASVRTFIEGKTLHISDDGFDTDLKSEVLWSLIEGYIKLNNQVKDGTKQMQDACLQMLVSWVL